MQEVKTGAGSQMLFGNANRMFLQRTLFVVFFSVHPVNG